jgi:ribosome-binding protein aMBF1 (putative translation factor)
MIKNERQYRITRTQAGRFGKALAEIVAENKAKYSVNILEQAQENALKSQLDDLNAELAEYEALRSGRITVFQADTFEELPHALIKARIAAGMSQKDLASQLGLKEQQVQKYEATNYASASFSRLLSIIEVLGVNVREEISFVSK